MVELFLSVTVALFIGAAVLECLVAWRYRQAAPLIWAAASIAAAALPARMLGILGNTSVKWALAWCFIASVAAFWRALWKASP